jgi:hypothetical protein
MPGLETELFAPPRVGTEGRPDGTLLLRSELPLGDYPPSMIHRFRAGADEHPERALAGAREGDGWRMVS